MYPINFLSCVYIFGILKLSYKEYFLYRYNNPLNLDRYKGINIKWINESICKKDHFSSYDTSLEDAMMHPKFQKESEPYTSRISNLVQKQYYHLHWSLRIMTSNIEWISSSILWHGEGENNRICFQLGWKHRSYCAG